VHNLTTDEVLFVVKGSDEIVMSLLEDPKEVDKVFEVATDLAKEGLRTLVFASRKLDSVKQAKDLVIMRQEGTLTE